MGACGAGAPGGGADAETERRPSTLAGQSTVYAPNHAVATSQPLATSAALRVLENGGNAFDAAVVAATVLNVVEPHMTGIGGDVFALAWSAEEGGLVGMRSIGRAGSLAFRDTLVARVASGRSRAGPLPHRPTCAGGGCGRESRTWTPRAGV